METHNNNNFHNSRASSRSSGSGLRRLPTQFGRLAMLFYPDRGYKRAVKLFREELRLTRGLLQALQNVGYRENQRVLTPRQVKVIEEFLG